MPIHYVLYAEHSAVTTHHHKCANFQGTFSPPMRSRLSDTSTDHEREQVSTTTSSDGLKDRYVNVVLSLTPTRSPIRFAESQDFDANASRRPNSGLEGCLLAMLNT